VLIGHFHTRWGQGLAHWTGFSMESLSTLDAFIKRSSTLSPAWSYAPTDVHRGVAGTYTAGRFRVVGYYAGRADYGAHADYLWHQGQVGLGYAQGRFSLDTRLNLRGLQLASEVAAATHKPFVFAAKVAVRGKLFSQGSFALQGRFIPNTFSGKKYGEYGFAAGLGWKSSRWMSLSGKQGFGSSVPYMKASLTADGSYLPTATDSRRYQVRVYGVWQWQMSPMFLLDLRFTERYRNYEAPRTDLRADFKAGSGPWLGVLRLEANHCGSWGVLSYLEGGYKSSKSALYLRLTGFSIPEWSARIYCYERDAPGTFSVPAYNGRGLSASAVASCKFRLFHRLTLKSHLRAALQLRRDQKPTPTLNLQLQLDL